MPSSPSDWDAKHKLAAETPPPAEPASIVCGLLPPVRSDGTPRRTPAPKPPPPAEPASIVCELLPLLPVGPALDIACGAGRHSLLLAARGQPVTAVGFSSGALDTLKARAHGMHLSVQQSKSFHPTPRR